MTRFIISLLLFNSIAFAQVECEYFYKPTEVKFDDIVFAEAKPAIDYKKLAEKHKSNPLFKYKMENMFTNITMRDQIKSVEEFPFDISAGFRPKAAQLKEVMISRFKALDQDMQNAILASYNRMNDPDAIREYLKELYTEAFDWASKNNKLMLDGGIPDRAISVAVVRRLKRKGDTKFTKITSQDMKGKYLVSGKYKFRKDTVTDSNSAFRAAVGNGPFIDSAFTGYSGHGAYAHMIQRDFIHQVLVKELGGDYEKFYRFLGTKKGIAFWADLFDAGNSNGMSFTRPETVSRIITGELLRD